MTEKFNKLEWIQALRGFAALMVVLVHSRFLIEDTISGRAVGETVLFPMAMGVDLFFLISGFLMVLTTSNFDGTARYSFVFLIKRMARIWPIYAIVSIAAVWLEHKGISGFYNPISLVQFLEGLVFIPHDPALYFNMSVDVAWTLCFEFYFYIVFGLAMFFGRYRYWAMAVWFAATLIVVPLVRGNFTLSVPPPDPIRGFRYANLAIDPIVWDFIFGMGAGWLYRSRVVIKSRATIYLTLTVLIGSILVNWTSLGLANFHGPRGWGTLLAIVFVGIVMLSKLGEIRVPTWSVWFGEISYSLYLTHRYVFEGVMGTAPLLHVLPQNATAYYLIVRIIAAIVVAYLTYRFIEVPTSSFFRTKLMRLFLGNAADKNTDSNIPTEPAPAPAGAP